MFSTEPKLIAIESFKIAGISVRTTNSSEFDEETAKIPTLWHQFFSTNIAEKIPKSIPNAPIYGVYSNYDSDSSGNYTVTAGMITHCELPMSKFNTVTIQKGNYLVFYGKGTMPQTVIQTWQRVWAYFESKIEYHRSYLTDFEAYNGADEVTIHIGVTKIS
jgi:predicted transcriptional regulator YdeE